MHDLDRSILEQLKSISNDAGEFAAGILSNDISRHDQISYGLPLVDLAASIRDRAAQTLVVIEGSVVDACASSIRQLLASNGEAQHRGAAAPEGQ